MNQFFILLSLIFVLGCNCPKEDIGFQQFTPKYDQYEEDTTEYVNFERNLANQLYSASRHELTKSDYLQSLCFRIIKDVCIVINYPGDLALYYPGKGMLLSPSLIESSNYRSELVSILLWEYNRRILRLPMLFDNISLSKQTCIEQRPDPSPESLNKLTKLVYTTEKESNPRALPLILGELNSKATCKSIGYFTFKKNYYFELKIGELRRKYANQRSNVTTDNYKKFYEQYFNKSA